MRILILGVTGMMGNAMHSVISQDGQHEVWGALRDAHALRYFPQASHKRLITGIDVMCYDDLIKVFNKIRPEVVVNCVGLIKQLSAANDPLSVLPINSILPHRLADACALLGARVVQLGSDCVFSGKKGNYRETDASDADDLYGKSKYIGELQNYPHAITLRTSGIGHELNSHKSLLEWFLAQRGTVKGFSKAIYSGLPSVELARVVKDFVLPHPELYGVYHVAAKPISKLDLLRLIADAYAKEIEIVPDQTVAVDRSLNGARFAEATGYVAADWPDLVQLMHSMRIPR